MSKLLARGGDKSDDEDDEDDDDAVSVDNEIPSVRGGGPSAAHAEHSDYSVCEEDDDESDTVDLSFTQILEVLESVKKKEVTRINTKRWKACSNREIGMTVLTKKRVRVLHECVVMVVKRVSSYGERSCTDLVKCFNDLCRNYNTGNKKSVNFARLREAAAAEKDSKNVLALVDKLSERVKWLCTQLFCTVYFADKQNPRNRAAIFSGLKKMAQYEACPDRVYFNALVEYLAAGCVGDNNKHEEKNPNAAKTVAANRNGCAILTDRSFASPSPAYGRKRPSVAAAAAAAAAAADEEDGGETDTSTFSNASTRSTTYRSKRCADDYDRRRRKSEGMKRICEEMVAGSSKTTRTDGGGVRYKPILKKKRVEEEEEEVCGDMLPFRTLFPPRSGEPADDDDGDDDDAVLGLSPSSVKVHRYVSPFCLGRREDYWLLRQHFVPEIGFSYYETVYDLLKNPVTRVSCETVHGLLKTKLIKNSLEEDVTGDHAVKERLLSKATESADGHKKRAYLNVSAHLDKINSVDMEEIFSVPWAAVQNWGMALASRIERTLTDDDGEEGRTTPDRLCEVLSDFVENEFGAMKRVFDVLARVSEPCLYILFGLDKSSEKPGSRALILSRQLAFLSKTKTLPDMRRACGDANMKKLMWCVPMAYLFKLSGTVKKTTEKQEISNEDYMSGLGECLG